MAERHSGDPDTVTRIAYDTIVVGSGNGACGFLSHALQHMEPDSKVLVLEMGDRFFNTSDITHQINWTKSYSEGNIFKLHNALTPNNIPIISGWACTMGGGGSINYTMIHESSHWLSSHIGQDEDYWDRLKTELNAKFHRPDPTQRETPITQHILKSAETVGFKPPDASNRIENIPSYRDPQDCPDGNTQQLFQFPTQFNPFGQRTNSGVSLVDWFCDRLHLIPHCQVTDLEFDGIDSEELDCVAVQVKYLDKGTSKQTTDRFVLAKGGRLILCAGAATPRLLMPHRERLNNPEIGRFVSDHIVLPLGIYIPNRRLDVTPKDVYAPVFATTVWQPEAEQSGQPTVCCTDFFAGNFEKLLFIVSHLYLAFLLPNWIKRITIRTPFLFSFLKVTIRRLIQIINAVINLEDFELITAIVKYNPAKEGEYCNHKHRINLGFFATDEDKGSGEDDFQSKKTFNQDKQVAKWAIAQQLRMMDELGTKPHWFVQCIFRLFTHIPFKEDQVDDYVETYSKKFLLSEQHMAGGCLFGKAIDSGVECPQNTGKVFGSTNVHVADLSASPLPRISPQMTAYAIGFHVAKQLFPDAR